MNELFTTIDLHALAHVTGGNDDGGGGGGSSGPQINTNVQTGQGNQVNQNTGSGNQTVHNAPVYYGCPTPTPK